MYTTCIFWFDIFFGGIYPPPPGFYINFLCVWGGDFPFCLGVGVAGIFFNFVCVCVGGRLSFSHFLGCGRDFIYYRGGVDVISIFWGGQDFPFAGGTFFTVL